MPLTRGEALGQQEVYIGRGSRGRAASKWCNPFKVGRDGTREGVINLFRLRTVPSFTDSDWEELRGMTLRCHCMLSDPCHGDVLVEAMGKKDGRRDKG